MCHYAINQNKTKPFFKNYFFDVRICKVKLANVVEGDQKAPFSIATTGVRRGRFSFRWISPLYPWYVPYIAEC